MPAERLDLYLTDSREPRVITHCPVCGGEIFEGEDVIKYDDEFFCAEECYQEALLQDNPPVKQIISREDV